jgi:hypothetical protein
MTSDARQILKRAVRGALHEHQSCLVLQAYIIGVLAFLLNIAAITEHPE